MVFVATDFPLSCLLTDVVRARSARDQALLAESLLLFLQPRSHDEANANPKASNLNFLPSCACGTLFLTRVASNEVPIHLDNPTLSKFGD
jgi:hypothetical protein